MKTLALISAVLCTMVIAAIAAPRSAPPADQGGAPAQQRAAITVPSRPADFQSGLTGNTWWAAQDKRAH